MRVGFTGTRKGMTAYQWHVLDLQLRLAFAGNGGHQWHDGDCLGADEQAHGIVNTLNRQRSLNHQIETHGHPCNKPEWRAHKEFDFMDIEYPPLKRNKIIVDSVDLMFAAPYGYEEQKIGSGTWATMRYAAKKGVKLTVIWPDGSITEGWQPS